MEKIKNFIRNHQDDIILLIGVVLVSFLSFVAGYITAKQQEKEQIKFEMRDANMPIHADSECVKLALSAYWHHFYL